MSSDSPASVARPADKSAGEEVLPLSPPPSSEVVTRGRLSRTRLGERHGILKPSSRAEAEALQPSIVTRRQLWLQRRRRKHILIALAIALAFFPPMWAVYLIVWLVWRNRPRQRSMRGVRKAVRALEKNQTGTALKQLQESHFDDPSNPDALYWLGLLLNEQGRREEAVEALALVADRVPGLPEVETALVEAYVETGQPEHAVYHAQRLLDVAPYDPKTLLKLADAFEAAGKTDLALEALERAPLHKHVLTEPLTEVHYRLGVMYEKQGDAERALRHFKRVYARNIAYRDVRQRVSTLESQLNP